MATNTTTQRSPVQVVTCILRFPDGQQVLGRIRQAGTRQRSPIVYVGDTKLLGAPFKLGTTHELRHLFTRVAQASGATLIVTGEPA